VIRWGTRASQQTIAGTLADIVEKTRAAKIEPPAVIVVGEVVRLRQQLNWFERRPLFGKRVLMTRAKEQAGELAVLLAGYGAEPIEAPTIEIAQPADWTPVDRAIDAIRAYDWVIFTSVNGVARFMTRMRARGRDARALAGCRLCCIGPRTAQELERFGLTADSIPADYQAEGVLATLGDRDLTDARVLIPRAEVARELLPDELRARGARVDVVSVYRTILPSGDDKEWRRQLAEGQVHAVTFTSSSTVRNFVALLGGVDGAKASLQGVAIACIGPITARTVEEHGLAVAIMPAENTVPALVEAIVHYYGSREQVATGT
jgi:uroporphyrinogen III methyltransferase/synthase